MQRSQFLSHARQPLKPGKVWTSHRSQDDGRKERQITSMIGKLRELVLAPPADSERFHVAFLDSTQRVASVSGFGVGCANALSLNLRDLFRHALLVEARSIIIAHNHPSGDCRPSDRDIAATKRIAQVAQTLDISLLDHLIFSKNGLYSMRKRGEL